MITTPQILALRPCAEWPEGRVETWTQTYGAALKPSGADTYGEGMRVAKWQVSNLIREGGLTDE